MNIFMYIDHRLHTRAFKTPEGYTGTAVDFFHLWVEGKLGACPKTKDIACKDELLDYDWWWIQYDKLEFSDFIKETGLEEISMSVSIVNQKCVL